VISLRGVFFGACCFSNDERDCDLCGYVEVRSRSVLIGNGILKVGSLSVLNANSYLEVVFKQVQMNLVKQARIGLVQRAKSSK
jgi:hypothetical protein